jgi:hypothetical protein
MRVSKCVRSISVESDGHRERWTMHTDVVIEKSIYQT